MLAIHSIFLFAMYVAPAMAQSDLADPALYTAGPDLLEAFRARPPMGDCPIGAADETDVLPEGSHLLHLGVPRFYRDYRRRLRLTAAQIEALSAAQDQALRQWEERQARIEELERTLWQVTGASELSMKEVERILGELSDERAAQRRQYIQSVWEASRTLDDDQRRRLVGTD